MYTGIALYLTNVYEGFSVINQALFTVELNDLTKSF